MKLATAQIEPFLENLPPTCRVVLLYGPDEGMNRLRAQGLIRHKLGEKPDPFQLVEFAANELSADPVRLLDEIETLPFGGDRKVIYIRQAGDGLASTIGQAIESCPEFSTLLIEAAELPPKSPLRQAIESADDRAAAIPAYQDEGRALDQFVRKFFADAQIKADADALRLLTSLLSGNRAINQQELQKLLLYIEPQKTVTIDDVEAALVGQADLGLDDVVFGAFSGQAELASQGLDKLAGEGLSGIAVLRALSRHAMRLHWTQAMIGAGSSAEDAIKMLRPPVFFKKMRAFESQLRRWSPAQLLKLLQRLSETEILTKSTGYPAEEIAAQMVMGICIQGRRVPSS